MCNVFISCPCRLRNVTEFQQRKKVHKVQLASNKPVAYTWFDVSHLAVIALVHSAHIASVIIKL